MNWRMSVLVTVPVYSLNDGKRNYRKADYCYYCNQKVTSKISRHLMSCHVDRKLVNDAVLAKGFERQNLLYKMRQLGNYQHNIKVTWLPKLSKTEWEYFKDWPQCFFFQVIQDGHGELVVARRPTTATPAWRYIPCTSCYAFCDYQHIHLHFKNCPIRKSDEKDSAKNGLFLLQPYIPSTTKLDEVIDGMREKSDHAGTEPFPRVELSAILSMTMSLSG